MSRRQLEKSGYLEELPEPVGLRLRPARQRGADPLAPPSRHKSGGDWTTSLAAADLVLSPAACYPVYPLVASRGRIPGGGLIFDVAADCFRREPSRSLDRLQSFRMREFVRIGTPGGDPAVPRQWMTRAQGTGRSAGVAVCRGCCQRSRSSGASVR